jgi:hypothetical protein
MRSPCCQCVWVSPYQLSNAWTNLYETWYEYHGNWAHLNSVLHKSLPLVCVSVCVSLLSLQGNCSVKCIPHFVAKQCLGKHVPAVTNTCNSRRIVEHVAVCLCIPLSLLGNNLVKTFPRNKKLLEASFSMRSMSYQRDVGECFFPERLVFWYDKCLTAYNEKTGDFLRCNVPLSLRQQICN